jgi:glycosyltransferase involved in cell wall biosynthesis
MKLLFVHNIKIKKDKSGNLYTHSSYNDNVWNRYLNITQNLSVITREDQFIYNEDEAKLRFELFDSEKIKNITVSDLTNSNLSFMNLSKRKQNNKIIEEAVLSNDLIIARLPSSYGYTAIKFAKRHKKPYLVEVVACAWDSLWNHSVKGKLLAPINYLKEKKYVKESLYTVYVTNEFLQRRYPTKGKSVNCSNVVLSDINENILQKRLSKIEQSNNDYKLIIGTTAAVNVRYKGQQYVIEALGELKKQGKTNYEYQLVGGGDSKYLRTIAEKHDVVNQVKFLGSMPHNKVFEWLDNIDLYVQPSRQEGLPRALVEAMSRALPAFGANTAGIPELLGPQFIFSNTKKNIKEIIDIIQTYDNELMKKQSIQNYNEAKKYNKTVIEKRRDSFFKEFKESKCIQ